MTTGNSKPQIDLRVGLDDSTKSGADSAKENIKGIGTAAQEASRTASEAIDKIGDAGEATAEKMDRASSSIALAMRRTISQTQRDIANLQSTVAGAGGANSGDAFERLIKNRGADAEALRPLVEQVRAVRREFEALQETEARNAAAAANQTRIKQTIELRNAATQASLLSARMKELAAAEAEAATKSGFVESLRQQAEAIGKTRSELLQLRAAQLGVSNDAAPYIAKLREQEQALNRTGKQLNQYGISAGQTAAALRQVPAQITDIVVSLQSGQAPLTVLFQQGGQLKDMFGGVVPAFKALASTAIGMIGPTTILLGVVGALGVAYFQGSKEADAYKAAIRDSGNAAGTSAAQLQQYAKEISAVVGTQGQAAEVLAALAGTGEVAARNMREFGQATVEALKYLDVPLKEVAKNFAALGEDPVKAAARLNKEIKFLTGATYDQIKALEDQGRKELAGEAAQKAYAAALSNRAAQAKANLGTLERGWNALASAAKEGWDRMLDVGRPKTNIDTLADLRGQLKRAEDDMNLKLGRMPNADVSGAQKGIEILKQRIGLYETDERQSRRLAQAEADRAQLAEASVRYGEFRNNLLTDEQKKEQEIIKIREAGMSRVRAGLMTEAELNKDIADFRAKGAKSTKGADNTAIARRKELEDVNAQIKASEEYTEALKTQGIAADKRTEAGRRAEQIEKLLGSEEAKRMDKATRQFNEELLSRLKRLDAVKQEENAEKDRQKALEKSVEAQTKAIDETNKEVEALEKKNRALRASIENEGKSATAIARVEAQRARQRFNELDGSDNALPAQLAALQRLAEESEEYVRNLQEADFTKATRTLEDQVALSKDQNRLVQEEIGLIGLSDLERRKIVATREAELRLAKELRDIDKMSLSEDPLEDEKRKEELRAKAREKATLDANTAVNKEIIADWEKTVQKYDDIFRQGFADMLNNGKDGWKSFTKSLATTFKTSVADAIYKSFARPLVVNLVSSLTGMNSSGISSLLGGAGGGGSGGGIGSIFSLASNANTAYNLYQGGVSGLTAPGSLYYNFATSSLGQSIGLSNAAPIIGNNISAYAPAGTQLTGLGGGGSAAAGAGSLAGAGVFAAIALAVINVLGGMRSETMIGSGLRGTLGNGTMLTPWQEWREGGTLASGPEFSTSNPLETLKEYRQKIAEYYSRPAELQNTPQVVRTWETAVSEMEKNTKGLEDATRKQSESINKAYDGVRSNVVKMANSLGLAGDSVKNFAFALETQDLNFQGLSAEQIQEKITTVLGKAGTTMAKELLGYFEPVTETITRTVQDNVGSALAGQDAMYVYREESETTTKQVYRPSQYAKAGETALDTLTRLSTAFVALNEAADALGFGAQKGSLALGDFADSFIELAGGLERFSATTNAFIRNYLSPEKQREYLARSGARDFQALGLNINAEQILGSTPEQVFAAVNSLASDPKLYLDAMDVANKIYPIYSALDTAAEKTEDLKDAVDELTQSFENAIKSLKDEADGLQVDLLRAQGRGAEADKLARDNFLAPFALLDEVRRKELETAYDYAQSLRRALDVQNERNGLQDELNSLTDTNAQALERQRSALDASNRALFDQVQAVKTLQAINQQLPALAGRYVTPAVARASGYEDVARSLRAEGYSNVTGEDLRRLTREQMQGLFTSIYNLGETSDTTRLALIGAANALTDLKDAERQDAANALERAYSAYEASVNKELERLNDTKNSLQAVFDTLKTNVQDLYRTVDDSREALAREGLRFVNEAYQSALSGGALPDAEKLTQAIGNARAGMDQRQYATKFDQEKDRLLLAGKLSVLQDISGDQLTEAEQQVKTLEDSLKEQRALVDAARLQLDATYQGTAATQDVATALGQLTAALVAAQALTTTGGGGGGRGVISSGTGASYNPSTGTGTNTDGLTWNVQDVKAAAEQALIAGNTKQVYDAIKDQGFTLKQAEAIFGLAPGSAEDWARSLGYPVFHNGINFVPETGMALLERGEQVTRAVDNPYGAGASRQSKEDRAREETLQVLARIEALLLQGNDNTGDIRELVDQVTEGGNAARVMVMSSAANPVIVRSV